MGKKFRFDRIIRSKKVMKLALIFVFIAILSMTLVYASLSTTLRITGSAEFKDASWNIVIEEAEVPEADEAIAAGLKIDGNTAIIGEAKLLNKPTITGTTISGFNIEIAKIGDLSYTFYTVTNNGEIPAMLESITWNENPTITSVSNNQEDIQLVRQYLVFSPVVFTDIWTTPIQQGDILCPGATYSLIIYSGYNSNAPRIPYSKITISNMSLDYNFIAANQNLCNGSTPVESEG